MFIRIDEEKVEYGLLFGSNLPELRKSENDTETVTDLKKFTFERLKEKLIDVYPKYRKYENVDGNFSDDLNYFWVTAKPSIWSVDTIENGGEVFFTAYNEKGNKRNLFKAFVQAKPNDQVLFYESTPLKEIVARGKVTKGLHEGIDEGRKTEGITIEYTDSLKPISWEQLLSFDELKESSPIKNGAQGTLFPLTKEEYETILTIEGEEHPEPESQNYSIPETDFANEINTEHLYFPNIKVILQQVKNALKNGKHIIFTGPPGTGKSKLAKAICEQLNGDYMIVTGTSDWSTFETIGGYRPNKESELQFSPGIFLKCFKEPETLRPINQWLIIDELNRADIDKAFGALFSVLTGDPVTLSFVSESSQPIQLIPQTENTIQNVNDYEYIVPKDWRLIGTMNTLDKASLYEMSYAFMRRFAFIPVPVPKKIDETLVRHYLEVWGIEEHRNTAEIVAAIWLLINKRRLIGPAIVEDMVRYLDTDFDVASAIALYVFPQLEGLMEDEIRSFITELEGIEEVDNGQLQNFAEDFFA